MSFIFKNGFSCRSVTTYLWVYQTLICRVKYFQIKCFLSYLAEQIVNILLNQSQVICVTSVVPQWAHLVPGLFNIFINNIVTYCCHCEIVVNADDLKIFVQLKSLLTISEVQEDMFTGAMSIKFILMLTNANIFS